MYRSAPIIHCFAACGKVQRGERFCIFLPLSLDFFVPACYNQRSFILSKTLMRTNRSPAFHAAERAAPGFRVLQAACHDPGFYHRRVQRRTSAGRARYSTARGAFPRRGARNSGGTVERRHLIGASSREFYGVKRFLFLFNTALSKENLL